MPWRPAFQSDLTQNLMQPYPNPNDASDKIWLNSACRLRRYSCLKVLTDTQPNRQTYRRRLDSHPMSMPRNGVVMITDCPDMTSVVYRGSKALNQTDKQTSYFYTVWSIISEQAIYTLIKIILISCMFPLPK